MSGTAALPPAKPLPCCPSSSRCCALLASPYALLLHALLLRPPLLRQRPCRRARAHLAHAAALAVAVLIEREEPLLAHQVHRLLRQRWAVIARQH